MKAIHLPPAYTPYMIIVGCLLVCALLGVFIIYPVFLRIKAISHDILESKDELLFVGLQDNQIRSFKKNYSAYQSNIESIGDLFVDAKNPIAFITFLEKNAARAGLSLDISLLPPLAGSTNSPLLFQLVTKGDFSRTLQFAEQVETGPYLASVKNMAFRRLEVLESGGKNSYQGVEASLVVEVAVK